MSLPAGLLWHSQPLQKRRPAMGCGPSMDRAAPAVATPAVAAGAAQQQDMGALILTSSARRRRRRMWRRIVLRDEDIVEVALSDAALLAAMFGRTTAVDLDPQVIVDKIVAHTEARVTIEEGWAAGSTQSLTGASGGTVRFRVPRGVRAADTFALLALFRNKITGEIRAEVPAAEPELIGTCEVQSILRGDFYSTQWCEAEAHRTAGVSSTILVKYLGPPWTGGGQSIQEELSLDSPRLRNFVSAGGRCAGNLADVRRRRRPASATRVVATFTEPGPIGLAFGRSEPHGVPQITAIAPDGIVSPTSRAILIGQGLAVGMRL